MKALFCILLLAATRNYAQCPFATTLQSDQGHCLGASLQVGGDASTFTKIAWYNGGTLDSVALATKTYSGNNGITAAGIGGKGSAANQLNNPLGIFVDAGGYLYVADDSNNRVIRYAPGATSGVVVAGTQSGNAPGQVIGPFSVTVDAAGNVYVLCSDGNNGPVVEKWPPGATTGTIVAGGHGVGAAADELFSPTQICLDDQGNIYISDTGNERVQKWAQGAAAGVTVAGGNGPGFAANQMISPQGIFVDANGNLYIADQNTYRVQEWPPGATSGITIAGGSSFDPGFMPVGVFVDGNGNMYVADPFNNRITEWAPGATSGVTVLSSDGTGSGPNQFNGAALFWMDNSGDMYVTDLYNNRVQEFKSDYAIDTVFTPSTPGEYTAVITNQYGCTVTTNDWLIAPSTNPLVTISSSANPVCSGIPVSFTAAVTNDDAPPVYQWQVNGTATGDNSPQYSAGSLNDGDVVRCLISSENTCASAASNNITESVLVTPSVDSGQVFSTQEGKPVNLDPVLTGDITAYTWSPSSGLSDTTVRDPVADPSNSMVYSLQVVAADGCRANGAITVKIFIPLSIPNAFTPNGDGRNDVFYVAGGPTGSHLADFSVFNRWGQKVFQAHDCPPGDPAFGWNGRINGQPAPTGTYVYSALLVLAGGTRTAYQGTVILIR